MAAPNEEELLLIQELRLRIEDLDLPDDLSSNMELVRWIRARDNDLVEAEAMIRKHMEWRTNVKYDQLSSWELPNHLSKCLPQSCIGFDEDNCPILLALVGKWNGKMVVQNTSREDALKPHWKLYSKLREEVRGKLTKDGTPVTQLSAIADLDGLSIFQATPQVLRALIDLAQSVEANFPESLKSLFFINCPWFVPKLYKILRPFVSQKTVDKLHFYGTNQEEWVGALRDRFPMSVLPVAYGGSNTHLLEFEIKK